MLNLELDNDSNSSPEVQSQNYVEVDDIENVYDEDTACQYLCCLDVNIAHQPEDVRESKVKDRYRHCKGPSRTIQTSWYQLYPWISVCTSRYKIYCVTCQSDKC